MGNLSYIRGSHALRFGGEFRVYQSNDTNYGYLGPQYTFGTGWTVGPLARTLILEPDESPACVVALSIHRVPRTKEEEKEYTATGVHAELCDVMKFVKGRFWSLVVSEAAGCTWNVGLGKLNEDGTDKEKAEAAKKVN